LSRRRRWEPSFAQECVFGGEQGASRCGLRAGRGVGAGVGDVQQRFGLAVDAAQAAGEGSFDQVDAVVGLLEAEGLMGEGAHHPGGVTARVGFAGELVADLVVALGGAFLAEVVVLPPSEVGEFSDRAERRLP
jgi:hypothetical protein